jgi:hypothetical protein
MLIEKEEIPMSALVNLDFVERVPPNVVKRGSTPLQKAKAKLIDDISCQKNLVRDPGYSVSKIIKKRDGTQETIRRQPRSWITYSDGYGYIIVRISNKPVQIGGEKGGVIRCAADQVIPTLETIQAWVESGEADNLISEIIADSKRGKRTA